MKITVVTVLLILAATLASVPRAHGQAPTPAPAPQKPSTIPTRTPSTLPLTPSAKVGSTGCSATFNYYDQTPSFSIPCSKFLFSANRTVSVGSNPTGAGAGKVNLIPRRSRSRG